MLVFEIIFEVAHDIGEEDLVHQRMVVSNKNQTLETFSP